MATSMPFRCVRLLDLITPQRMVLINQKRILHVTYVSSIRRKAQNVPKTDQVLRKANAKTEDISGISPDPCVDTGAGPVNKVKQVTSQSLLEDIGISVKKIDAWIDVKKLSVEKVKKTLNFLGEIGIEQEDKGKIISRRPGILAAKEDLLRRRVQAMRNVGIYPDSVAYVVRESPGVLTGRTEESLPEKIKFFENMRVKPKFTNDEILHVFTKCPHIIATYTVESLEDKVQLFEKELKFNKHHIKNIILKQPSVLTFSKEAILKKYKYCFDKMNVSPSSIARCPRVFQCSLKRIKERHEFLKHLGRITDKMRMDDYGLGLIITTSDKQFVEKVAKTSLEEFKQFVKDMDSILSLSVEKELTVKPQKAGSTGDAMKVEPAKHIEETF